MSVELEEWRARHGIPEITPETTTVELIQMSGTLDYPLDLVIYLALRAREEGTP